MAQQARFDDFVSEFNIERPHEAPDMLCPNDVYQTSPKHYTGREMPTLAERSRLLEWLSVVLSAD